MPVKVFIALCLMFVILSPALSWAEDESGEEVEDTGSSYVKIDPAFVTNYGGTNRLRYVKVDVTLKVANGPGQAQVAHHLPVIKDSLLMLLSQQGNDTIDTVEGKEALRSESLAKIAELLAKEDGESHVQEVLFTSFVAHTL